MPKAKHAMRLIIDEFWSGINEGFPMVGYFEKILQEEKNRDRGDLIISSEVLETPMPTSWQIL